MSYSRYSRLASTRPKYVLITSRKKRVTPLDNRDEKRDEQKHVRDTRLDTVHQPVQAVRRTR